MTTDTSWLGSGQGVPPEQTWAFTTDAPLADLGFARETGETLAADVTGGLYRLNRGGRIVGISRGFKHLRNVAWSDTANFGVALLGSRHFVRFDSQLQIAWTMQTPSDIQALAMDPFGHYAAVALDSSQTYIVGADRRVVSEFPSVRPLHFLRFVATYRDVIGAADYGVIQRQQFLGEPVWEEKLLSKVGDLAITGDGRFSYLASYNHGIQVYDSEGYNHASYVVKGTPSRLSTSFDGENIIAATQENYLYRMNPKGELLWAAEAPDGITRLHSDPLGHGFVCGFASGRVVRYDWNDR